MIWPVSTTLASRRGETPVGVAEILIYVDNSGDKTQGDMFVMVGLLVDAYRLRKANAEFDKMIVDFLEKHPNPRKELKAKALINGADKWSKVAPGERKQFIADICGHVCGCMSLYPVAFSMSDSNRNAKVGSTINLSKNHWLRSRAIDRLLVATEDA